MVATLMLAKGELMSRYGPEVIDKSFECHLHTRYSCLSVWPTVMPIPSSCLYFMPYKVRARGVSKGNFVHMVLSRLGWSSEDSGLEMGSGGLGEFGGGRFCLCVGDDVSDEDMFLAVKVKNNNNCCKSRAMVDCAASMKAAGQMVIRI